MVSMGGFAAGIGATEPVASDECTHAVADFLKATIRANKLGTLQARKENVETDVTNTISKFLTIRENVKHAWGEVSSMCNGEPKVNQAGAQKDETVLQYLHGLHIVKVTEDEANQIIDAITNNVRGIIPLTEIMLHYRLEVISKAVREILPKWFGAVDINKASSPYIDAKGCRNISLVIEHPHSKSINGKLNTFDENKTYLLLLYSFLNYTEDCPLPTTPNPTDIETSVNDRVKNSEISQTEVLSDGKSTVSSEVAPVPSAENPVAPASEKLPGSATADAVRALNIATTEEQFMEHLSEVAQETTKLGISAVSAATQIQVLNTWLDLVQRIATHLTAIGNAEKVNAAQMEAAMNAVTAAVIQAAPPTTKEQ